MVLQSFIIVGKEKVRYLEYKVETEYERLSPHRYEAEKILLLKENLEKHGFKIKTYLKNKGPDIIAEKNGKKYVIEYGYNLDYYHIGEIIARIVQYPADYYIIAVENLEPKFVKLLNLLGINVWLVDKEVISGEFKPLFISFPTKKNDILTIRCTSVTKELFSKVRKATGLSPEDFLIDLISAYTCRYVITPNMVGWKGKKRVTRRNKSKNI